MAKSGKRNNGKYKTASAAPLTKNMARRPAAESNNIRNWRLFRKLAKQSDLAKLAGLPSASISRLETGEMGYNQKHIHILARALGVAPRDLIGTNPFDAGDIFAVYAGLSDDDKRLAAALMAKLKR